MLHPIHRLIQFVGRRQEHDPEMVLMNVVETRSRDDQYLLIAQQIVHKLPVVGKIEGC